jgi:hypothetical protein
MTRTAIGMELAVIDNVPLVGLVSTVTRIRTNVMKEVEGVNRRASTPMEVTHVNV